MRFIASAALIVLTVAVTLTAASAALKPGDATYDAILKRVGTIPADPSVEVVDKLRGNRGPYLNPEMRNVPILGAIIMWGRLPVPVWSIVVYEPSENTLGSIATLERELRKRTMREPESARGISEAQPGGPRHDVWCPQPKEISRYSATIIDIDTVGGLPAARIYDRIASDIPECAAPAH